MFMNTYTPDVTKKKKPPPWKTKHKRKSRKLHRPNGNAQPPPPPLSTSGVADLLRQLTQVHDVADVQKFFYQLRRFLVIIIEYKELKQKLYRQSQFYQQSFGAVANGEEILTALGFIKRGQRYIIPDQDAYSLQNLVMINEMITEQFYRHLHPNVDFERDSDDALDLMVPPDDTLPTHQDVGQGKWTSYGEPPKQTSQVPSSVSMGSPGSSTLARSRSHRKSLGQSTSNSSKDVTMTTVSSLSKTSGARHSTLSPHSKAMDTDTTTTTLRTSGGGEEKSDDHYRETNQSSTSLAYNREAEELKAKLNQQRRRVQELKDSNKILVDKQERDMRHRENLETQIKQLNDLREEREVTITELQKRIIERDMELQRSQCSYDRANKLTDMLHSHKEYCLELEADYTILFAEFETLKQKKPEKSNARDNWHDSRRDNRGSSCLLVTPVKPRSPSDQAPWAQDRGERDYPTYTSLPSPTIKTPLSPAARHLPSSQSPQSDSRVHDDAYRKAKSQIRELRKRFSLPSDTNSTSQKSTCFPHHQPQLSSPTTPRPSASRCNQSTSSSATNGSDDVKQRLVADNFRKDARIQALQA